MVSSECSSNCLSAIVWVTLVDLDNGVEPAATARSYVNVSAVADLIDLVEDGGFFGHTHEELVLVPACKDGLINRVAPTCDTSYFDNWLLTGLINYTC